MAEEKFDSIIVGAGPAGISAAIILARAGLEVVVLERGEYPGAKNVQGAVLYTKMLSDILPDFWKDSEAALERPITEQNVWMTSDDSGIRIGFRSDLWKKEPHNCYTIIRVAFDKWYSQKAEQAGAQIYCGVTVKEVIKKENKIVGIRTSEGEELFSDCVIACDGVNSMLAQSAGLLDEWKSSEVALGVKETLALSSEKIEDRFCLEKDEGSTMEIIGNVTQGMMGYAFLYTNKESLSLGVGCKLSDFQKTGIRPYDLLESVKKHTVLRRYISGATPVEYSAHLIPEGGYKSMPPLYTDGMLVAGDAAQMVNPSHREGSNHAMTAGKFAAETVIEAKKKGSFSSDTLSAYQKKLEESFILKDLYDHRDLEESVEKSPALLLKYPDLACRAAFQYFSVSGKPKREVQRGILRMFRRERGLFQLAKDAKGMFKIIKDTLAL